jgi:hypothetical protein
LGFLILDGLFGMPAKLYDASWIEWGNMATTAKGGVLPASSPWRTDIPTLSSPITYNLDAGKPIDTSSIINAGVFPYALQGNEVNVTDAAACPSGGASGPAVAAPGY